MRLRYYHLRLELDLLMAAVHNKGTHVSLAVILDNWKGKHGWGRRCEGSSSPLNFPKSARFLNSLILDLGVSCCLMPLCLLAKGGGLCLREQRALLLHGWPRVGHLFRTIVEHYGQFVGHQGVHSHKGFLWDNGTCWMNERVTDGRLWGPG